MNNRPKQNDYKVFISIFPPKTSGTKGHATLDVLENDQPVQMISHDGQEKVARLSVYPSSKAYTFPFPMQAIFDAAGIKVKANVLGDLTKIPVDGFSTRSMETDLRIEDKPPKKVYVIEHVSPKVVELIREKQKQLSTGETKFLLKHNTGSVAFMLQFFKKAVSVGTLQETFNFKDNYGHEMPDDLILTGGANPDHSESVSFGTHHNCASAIEHVLHDLDVFDERRSFPSFFPNDLDKKLENTPHVRVISSKHFDQLPPSLRDPILAKREEYKERQKEKLISTIHNLENDPEQEINWIKDLRKTNSTPKQSMFFASNAQPNTENQSAQEHIYSRPGQSTSE